MKVGVQEMRCTAGAARDDLGSAPEQVIEINNLVINHQSELVISAPITGRCSYSIRGRFTGSLAINLYNELPGRCTCSDWYYPVGMLAPEGIVEFTFIPLERSPQHDRPWTGTTTGFVRFCAEPNRQTVDGGVPLSNACCVLLDVVG